MEDLRAAAPALRAANRSACVIVASDGESSDGDVAQALRALESLPCRVQVVVRLCTDDEKVSTRSSRGACAALCFRGAPCMWFPSMLCGQCT